MKARYVPLVLIALSLWLVLSQVGQAPAVASAGAVAAPAAAKPGGSLLAATAEIAWTPIITSYLPMLQYDLSDISCSTGQSYGSFGQAGGTDNIPAAQHPDKNLAVRGYELDSGGGLGFTYPGGAEDHTAPQLPYLLSPAPTAPFAHVYKVYNWVWANNSTYGNKGNLLGDTLLGIATTKDALVRLPVRLNGDFPVAEDPPGTKYYGMVIYAAATRITIVYTSHDTVVGGYTIHVENVCVDPDLVSLYNQLNSAGRGSLPGLRYNQAFGLASGTEVMVAIRDGAGTFLDPRVSKDWWVP
jgi:hypothetical protein